MLPLLSSNTADPLQPVRVLATSLAAGFILVAGGLTAASRESKGIFALVAALAGWTILAATLSQPASSIFGVHTRFQALVSLLALVSIGIAATRLSGRQARSVLSVVALAGAGVGAAVIVQVIVGNEWPVLFGNRVVAGAWLAVCGSVATALYATSAARQRAIYGAAGLLAFAGAGAAGSRGSWVGIAVAVAVLFAATSGPVRRRVALGALALAAALALGIAAGGPASIGKADPTALAGGSAASRLEIWKASSVMIADSPIVGVGPGRFIYEYPAYQSNAHARLEPETRADQAHSLLLHTAAESGVPAALLGLATCAAVVAVGWRSSRARDGVALVALAGFSAYLGQAAFGVAAIEPDALGWLLGGLVVARAAGDGARSDGASRGTRIAASALGVVFAVLAVMASLVYLRADAAHARSLESLGTARFDEAYAHSSDAVGAVGAVDTYRVGLADAALYLGADASGDALMVIERGLELEPASYDLAVAKARLLRASDAPADQVADAWVAAVTLWPRGAQARTAAAEALEAAGRQAEASRLRAGEPEAATP